MKNEVEQIALQNDMSIEFVTWFFNEKKVGCGNVWFMMMAAMWEGWKGRSIEMDKLATENMALKATSDDRRMFIMNGVQLGYIKVPTVETDPALETIRIAVSPQERTPATDRIVAGIKADAIDEAAVELDRVDTVASTRVIGFKLREFSQQLREGDGK
ncbi:hypothetical protein ACWJPZ_11305 [Klebsiella pneumoniae]|uniref:hypothetical protein n=1 Tax=Klebsiella pneumoniae TaxID=573 RepID=UPI000E2A40EB|nr:hypothetical protein [Klebsiella pneumoniae]HDT1775100.1 hypothetical protein [Klebsiella pneumoniae subsp. pneumoniae]EJG5886930.1 hypothetical protein [Klebsiella pneumoniae]EKS2099022.1 hypothetical protein [Klebsiella pneumoniae]ELR0658520.1 hypothetical protein [Klebsiella pneumoniae]